jgi:hypothetical protein
MPLDRGSFNRAVLLARSSNCSSGCSKAAAKLSTVLSSARLDRGVLHLEGQQHGLCSRCYHNLIVSLDDAIESVGADLVGTGA